MLGVAAQFTLLEFLELNMDLVNLEAQVHFEVGEFVDLLFQRTNQILEVDTEIIRYLQYINIINVIVTHTVAISHDVIV